MFHPILSKTTRFHAMEHNDVNFWKFVNELFSFWGQIKQIKQTLWENAALAIAYLKNQSCKITNNRTTKFEMLVYDSTNKLFISLSDKWMEHKHNNTQKPKSQTFTTTNKFIHMIFGWNILIVWKLMFCLQFVASNWKHWVRVQNICCYQLKFWMFFGVSN